MRHPYAVGIDSRTVALGLLSVVAAVLIGYKAGAWPGVLAALAGLASTALWEIAHNRRERNVRTLEQREAALRAFGPDTAVTDPSLGGWADLAERGAAWYLRPEAEVVGFRSRPELNVLREWCVAEGRIRVRLVTGEGGVGKTRLAVQLAAELAEDGWRTMFVPRGQEGEAVGHMRMIGEPALLVVDYAETRPYLSCLLADAVAAGDGPELRVLLLARSAGEWWQQLLDEADYQLSQVLEAAAPIGLGLLEAPGGPDELFSEAVIAFADRLGLAHPDARLVMDDPQAVILMVHAAALLAVLDHASTGGERVQPSSAAGVLIGLLGHEARYWHQSAVARGLILDSSVERLAVAVACLLGAESEDDAAAALSQIPDLADSAELRGRVGRWLHDLYPGSTARDRDEEYEWIGGLRPNRVAEHLITGELAERPSLLHRLLAGRGGDRLVRPLTVLARAALTDVRAGRLLHDALKADLENLAIPALTVAVETNPSVADMISDALTAGPVPRAFLEQIAAALPDRSFTLAGTAAIVFQRLAAGSAPGSSSRARLLANLSNRLADLGQREEGLAAAEEAVSAYRELARERPGAYQADLALALNNQSNHLAALGRQEQALAAVEEAVTIRRELTRARRDAYLPDLAHALNNQSIRLAEQGQLQQALAAAEEAVSAYRELARERPGAYQADLALALNNQSNHLAALGRQEQALAAVEEAVTSYRELAREHPDAYLPDLARSLNNLSNHLGSLGRREKALAAINEAVTTYRVLARIRPDAYLPDLGRSLNNQSGHLANLGQQEQALVANEEAVRIRRVLAHDRPDAFLPDLAASLNNKSVFLADLGRQEEGLAAIEEAVAVYRELARAHPDTFLPDFAGALNNLSSRLGDLGRQEEGLAAIKEAVAVYRELARAHPDAFQPRLAGSLNNLSIHLVSQGQQEDALTAIEEAVIAYRELARAHPDAFLPDLARSLNNKSLFLANQGKQKEARAAIGEAVTAYLELARAQPTAFADPLARSLEVQVRMLPAPKPDT